MLKKILSHDDVSDIIEIKSKFVGMIEEIFDENDKDIAISSLISTLCEFIFKKSDNIEEYLFYRDVIIRLLNPYLK
jgi:oligoribonuclease (3'-5' exoribonuclease)